MVIVQIIFFLLLLIVFFYLPGRFILRLLGFSHVSFIVTFTCSFVTGLSIFLTTEYFLSWFHGEFIYLLPAVFTLDKELFPTIREWKKNIKIRNVFSYYGVIIIIGSGIMSYIMWTSGLYDKAGNLVFYGTNAYDAIWHISLIGNLTHQFPPTHPGISGEILRGYNFFYDFLLAKILQLYHFNTFDLYFRYSATFLSILFGLSALSFVKNFTNNKTTIAFFLFLSYFTQSIGQPLLHVFHVPYDSGIVQPIANIVDPSVILSIILLYTGIVLLFSNNKKTVVLSSLIFGVLPMIKIYTAFLAFAALFGIAVYALLNKRRYQFFVVFLLAGITASILYIPINFGAGSLIFAPFLLYREYMESGAVIPGYQWILKYQVYAAHHNIFRIVELYAIAVFLFYIPSAGLRLLSIVEIKKLFKKEFYSYPNVFLMIACIVGILIPTFFIQSIAVFVTIQFIWIVYIIALLPTAFSLSFFYSKFGKLKYLLTFVLIAISIPETYSLIMLYSKNPVIVDRKLVQAIAFLEDHSRKDSSVLVLRSESSYAVPIVSAVSSRSVYYEPELLEFLHIEKKLQERKRSVSFYKSALDSCVSKTISTAAKQMRQEGIGYILYEGKNSCLNHNKNIRTINTSGPYKIYQL